MKTETNIDIVIEVDFWNFKSQKANTYMGCGLLFCHIVASTRAGLSHWSDN